jgi:signal transduction histidine kinase
MLSFAEVEFACVGATTVVDVVLLLTLAERRNYRHAVLPIVLLVVGTCLWHGGAFVHLFLFGVPGNWTRVVQCVSMWTMVAGLLLIPSAMLHGIWRLSRTGLATQTSLNYWYLAAYLPLVMLPPVCRSIAVDPSAEFFVLVHDWVMLYAVWLGLVNVFAAIGMLRLRRRFTESSSRQFLFWMALALVALALYQSFTLLYAFDEWPDQKPTLLLGVVVSPLLPVLLFAYFVVRFNFMRLVFKRTIIYGAIIAGLWLAHHILFAPLLRSLAERYLVDLGIVEAIVLVSLVLLYRPLRRRVAEALRYLMGSRVDITRQGCRRLSLELSGLIGRPPREILTWFVAGLKQSLSLKYATIWLFDPQGKNVEGYGAGPSLSPETVQLLANDLAEAGLASCDRDTAPTPAAADCLDAAGAALAVIFRQGNTSGLLLLGRTTRNRDLGEEEAGAVLLLCEQLAVTLNNSALQIEALAAERHALQNDKLSALGLLASSIAHEVKNPLSSIKTIATVMAEDLGDDHPHAEDLRLVLGEIDRLSTTTSQLLQFARPASSRGDASHLAPVIRGMLQMMRHLARQRGVELEAALPEELPSVRVDENALREICFNLISNSIEAAGANGRVVIRCYLSDEHVVAHFQDNGPGIPPEVQDRMFEPFVSTKPLGTGLGLYTINRRVQECGGDICCESGPERGTCFTVKLPCSIPQPTTTQPEIAHP